MANLLRFRRENLEGREERWDFFVNMTRCIPQNMQRLSRSLIGWINIGETQNNLKPYVRFVLMF